MHRCCPGKLKCRKQGQEPSQGYPKVVVLIANQNGAQVKNREADLTGRVRVQTETGQDLRYRELLSVQRRVTKGSLSEHTAPVLLQWSLCMGSPR